MTKPADIARLATDVNNLSTADFIALLDMVRPVSAKECATAIGVSRATFDRMLARDPRFPCMRTYRRLFRLSAVFKHLREAR